MKYEIIRDLDNKIEAYKLDNYFIMKIGYINLNDTSYVIGKWDECYQKTNDRRGFMIHQPEGNGKYSNKQYKRIGYAFDTLKEAKRYLENEVL